MKSLPLLLVALSLCARAAEPPKLYAIPSWGDYTVVYGPGTDPAMDSPEAMEGMFRFWKGGGFRGVFLRSDLQQYDSFVRRNPRVQMNPALALMWRYIDVQAERFDYFTAAQQAAEKTGLEFWVYHPHIYSEGAPEDVGVPGGGRMVPWSYVSKALYEHPEMVTVDRKGHRYWMVPEYAYPEARRAKAAEFVHMAKKYGVKQFIANMRTEVNQLLEPADDADRFGFNEPIVREMQRRHAVDIMADARFDVDSPTFDRQDPLVQKWRDLRGEYLTQLYREIRQALRAQDPQIKFAITLSGEFIGPPLGNWRTDWRTWVDEGLVDYLVSPVMFEGSLDHEAAKKGYLTNFRAALGMVSHQTLSAYIKQSAHPEIQVIATGGPSYFFTPPAVPAGATGWQCDVWLSSYHRAWYQRWEQWLRDYRDFGHIKFLEQNFDAVSPPDFAGISGGWGLIAYDPKLRACPGGWWRLGTGADARPFAQAAVRRGASGQALQLTSAPDGSGALTGFHNASPDRSKLTGALDPCITNGRCTFEFWLQRKSAASALTAFLQADGSELDIGLRIAPETGKISSSTGRAGSTATWVETSESLPPGAWQKLAIEVDLERGHYSAYLGETSPATLCAAIPFTMPKERFVEQHGIGVPIAVPVFKQFQRVSFTPEGKPGSISYLDDVTVRWQPALHFAPAGSTIALREDFEAHPVQRPPGGDWQPPASGESFYVINGTSYAAGVRSLCATGGGKLTAKLAQTLSPAQPATLDFDLFLRSTEAFPHLIPNPAAKSPHRTAVSLASSEGHPLLGVRAGEGRWELWENGAWIKTEVPIHYDVWNHLQLALDGTGTYRLTVQPAGQMPAPAGHARLPASAENAAQLVIETSATPGHISCYDNLLVTTGKP